jgi:hypothetical protein
MKIRFAVLELLCKDRQAAKLIQDFLGGPSKSARKVKTRKTKINFPLLPEKRRREQRSVFETKELV